VTTTFANATYVLASLLFIMSLKGLSQPESARRGNLLGTVGMILAILVTGALLFTPGAMGHEPAAGSTYGLLAAMIGVGCVIGAVLAARVAMTQMPELVAMLHSFVGIAAVLVGIATQMAGSHGDTGGLAHVLEIFIGVFVGAITFTGSVVAFLKLRGSLSGKPLLLPARHFLNLALVIGCVVASVIGIPAEPATALNMLLVVTVLSCILGIHLVAAIGGGDMPVVVSMLNSYSGWAAAAAGFMLSNDLLIVTGALVGASGAILSYIMCEAMNRSIWNVIFGGFGTEGGKPAVAAAGTGGPVRETNVGEVGGLLTGAKKVIFVPGYGMAVAQAQHVVKEITEQLGKKGVEVRYAIHPVAGRLPGHMNVLLAEAGVSYEIVKEMDEINEDFPKTDVAVIIGANDIVNPSALDDPGSPIYGMPVLEVWKAGKVVMLKRSMNAGYAGVDNPLCYRDNTLMLFGDAKQSVSKLLASVQAEG
jgi:NAD(P) transhydrogenase subunit beta